MPTRLNEFGEIRYQLPDENELHTGVKNLLDAFRAFLAAENVDMNVVDVDQRMLVEVVVRVERRVDYFRVYHDGTEINELKEAALVAYWLRRLKPFRHRDDSTINENFGLFVIFCIIRAISEKYSYPYLIEEPYKRQLKYAMLYWDLSLEALMMAVQSLCPFDVRDMEGVD